MDMTKWNGIHVQIPEPYHMTMEAQQRLGEIVGWDFMWMRGTGMWDNISEFVDAIGESDTTGKSGDTL